MARDIARSFAAEKNLNGALEGDQYIVTWGLGHLVTLADPEDYDPKYKTWRMEDLPMMPDQFKLEVIKNRQGKQFSAVKSAQLQRKRIQAKSLLPQMQAGGRMVAPVNFEKALPETDQATLDFVCH